MTNNKNQQIPISLKIVATLFILGGIKDVIEILVAIMQGSPQISLGFLGIFIGFGLLSLRSGWRTCALVFIWIVMVGVPLFAIMALTSPDPLYFIILGQKVGHSSKELVLLVAAVLFSVSFWEYRVLTRDDVRQLFE